MISQIVSLVRWSRWLIAGLGMMGWGKAFGAGEDLVWKGFEQFVAASVDQVAPADFATTLAPVGVGLSSTLSYAQSLRRSIYLGKSRTAAEESPVWAETEPRSHVRPAAPAITMEPFIVLERTRVEYMPPPHRNLLIEAIKTGDLWKRVGRVLTSEVLAVGEMDRGGFGRLTLRVNFAW